MLVPSWVQGWAAGSANGLALLLHPSVEPIAATATMRKRA